MQRRPRERWRIAVTFSDQPRRCSRRMTSVTVGCAAAAPAEPSVEALSSTRTSVSNGRDARSRAMASSPRSSSSRCPVFPPQKEISTAMGAGTIGMRAVRVAVVDPSSYTPAYDHALCAALGRAGADVELLTSAFAYGDAPAPEGYDRREVFYGRAVGSAGSRVRLAAKLAQHVPDMLRLRRGAAARDDVLHFPWFPGPPPPRPPLPWPAPHPVDVPLLPHGAPPVLTAHDVLPREPRPGTLRAQRRLYGAVDAVVAHTAHGRARLIREAGVPAYKVTVIPHGVLPLPAAGPLLGELAGVKRPVVLFFGLLRPYKGLDVLLDAWRGVEGAELWIAGMPRMDVAPLRAASPPSVRWLLGYRPDAELAALVARADLIVLPYREIEQSGVLFTALGAGKPLVLSDVGGFAQVEAAVHVGPGDPVALRAALRDLLGAPTRRAELAAAAARSAREDFGWDPIAQRTLALYASLQASPSA